MRKACYLLPESERPRIVGRHDEHDRLLVDPSGTLEADRIARLIAARISYFHANERLQARLKFLKKPAGTGLVKTSGGDFPVALFLLRLSPQHVYQSP